MTDSGGTGVSLPDVTPSMVNRAAPNRAMGPDVAAAPRAAALTVPPFREVYEAHVDLVFRTLRRLGVPAAAVEDVAQEVFLSVHRALPSWEGRSSLRTWVYRIAHNTGLNHKRAASRRPDRDITDSADETAHLGRDPEAEAACRQELGELGVVLSRMDESKREVLLLMELEGFTAPETAELLAVPLNTVYSRLRLARAELERLLGEGAS